MGRQVEPTFAQNGVFGGVGGDWVGTNAVDGDRGPWVHAPTGSVYWKRVTGNQHEKYVKIKNDSRNDDWVLEKGFIVQHIDVSDFEDGGATSGTLNLNGTIPVGAYFLRAYLVNNSAATGVSTLVITIGDDSDADRYNTGTPSVASAAKIISLGAPSGIVVHTADVTPVVTLTEDSDFGDIEAWSTTVVMEYTGVAV